MSFSHSVDVECPDCPPQGRRRRRPQLECTEHNYSGCGFDMANCSECGRGYSVSYKVDKVSREKGWDGPSREEEELEEAEEAKKTAELEKAKELEKLSELKTKYPEHK